MELKQTFLGRSFLMNVLKVLGPTLAIFGVHSLYGDPWCSTGWHQVTISLGVTQSMGFGGIDQGVLHGHSSMKISVHQLITRAVWYGSCKRGLWAQRKQSQILVNRLKTQEKFLGFSKSPGLLSMSNLSIRPDIKASGIAYHLLETWTWTSGPQRQTSLKTES